MCARNLRRWKLLCGLGVLAALVGLTVPAGAQVAVIDAAALTQLLSEVQSLEQQVATARNQLTQAQAEFQSITGNRGMQLLLAGTVRNYLPQNWATVQGAAQGTAGAFPALTGDVARATTALAVLSGTQLTAMPPAAAQTLLAERQSAALLQALSHEALANSSARFATLQQLIDAIGAAPDQKAILELQTRISAEQAMLQNEHNKLQDLYQAALADQLANAERAHELSVAGQGQFASRFQPRP
jgi:type IV secretion system protein VirB5